MGWFAILRPGRRPRYGYAFGSGCIVPILTALAVLVSLVVGAMLANLDVRLPEWQRGGEEIEWTQGTSVLSGLRLKTSPTWSDVREAAVLPSPLSPWSERESD